MHQARGAGKRKSPKRFSLLAFVLIGDTGTRRMVLRLACAHLNHAACNLHGLGCDKRSPPVSSQNSTDSPIYGGARLSRPQSRWFCKCLCMVKRGRIVRSTFFPGLFCVARRAFPCVPW